MENQNKTFQLDYIEEYLKSHMGSNFTVSCGIETLGVLNTGLNSKSQTMKMKITSTLSKPRAIH